MSTYNITRATTSRINTIDLNHLQPNDFGKYPTDHIASATFKNGKWEDFKIYPFDTFLISPLSSSLHYGQTIFEGLKAYRSTDGNIATFRIKEHANRLNVSAKRLDMPEFPEAYFVEAIEGILKLDAAWTPPNEGSAMYIRPFMFSNDSCLMARAASEYQMMFVCCPVGAYYSKALNVRIETDYTRAAIGGTGNAKAGGNYAASFNAAKQAMAAGFDQVIWTDAKEHLYIEEMGASNIMFLIDDIIYTPSLESKTILDGITRKTVIELLLSQGKKVIEKKIAIEDIILASKEGKLKEAFAVGTAATASPIASITYGKEKLIPSDTDYSFSENVKKTLNDIRYGKIKDAFGWMKPIATV